jgi:3',5'-cyclic AMP phosphodiesterase CpdA
MKGTAKGKWVVAASVMVAFLTLGCGEQKERAAIETSASPATAPPQQAPQAVVAAAATTTPESGIQEGKTTADSLPPDVTAFAPDSLVTPGQVVEITAQASTDAAVLILTDGLGHKYPFTYDTDAKAWRVHYRVPIRTHEDRLGLSVTASSGTNRWKRVWVFLKTGNGEAVDSGE